MCNYHRPVCVSCKMDMLPEKNGVMVLDVASFGPYQLWAADKWKCPDCGHEIVVGFSRSSIGHYQEGFQTMLEGNQAKGNVIEVMCDD